MASDLPESEKLADDSDRATVTEMEFTDESIRRARKATQQMQKPRPDGTYAQTDCDDCGLEIGEERLRLAAANYFCWHCATKRERRR
jgi:RNA polymerase-binding transcription factor DksA